MEGIVDTETMWPPAEVSNHLTFQTLTFNTKRLIRGQEKLQHLRHCEHILRDYGRIGMNVGSLYHAGRGERVGESGG